MKLCSLEDDCYWKCQFEIGNEAAKAQIDYRDEKKQEVKESLFMILDGIKKRAPMTFGTVEKMEETKEYYDAKGGK